MARARARAVPARAADAARRDSRAARAPQHERRDLLGVTSHARAFDTRAVCTPILPARARFPRFHCHPPATGSALSSIEGFSRLKA